MATETPEDRRNRHCTLLAELAGLAMDLARDAAAAARQAPEPQPHILAFTRLAAAARQAIALEARLSAPAAAAKGQGHAARAQPPIHDPERARIGRIVRDNAKRATDGPILRDINRYLETRLQHPDIDEAIQSTAPIGVIARQICQELNIPFDLAQQPDDVIRQKPGPPTAGSSQPTTQCAHSPTQNLPGPVFQSSGAQETRVT